jgi:hypothetical protein
MVREPEFSALVRGVIALALTASLPVVIYFGHPSREAAQAYQDALAVVIAFYFGTEGP